MLTCERVIVSDKMGGIWKESFVVFEDNHIPVFPWRYRGKPRNRVCDFRTEIEI
jgi:hypothetical protein